MTVLRHVTIAAVMAFALGQISGCASVTAYEANHPYYKFPVGACGGCGPGG